MKFQNNTLQSGNEYTLSTLFQGKNKIIIPDLQRDYCWGDRAWDKDAKDYTELVSGFLGNLIESYKEDKDKKQTLGLIYGYENPRYHIQLCDGQQRITTLFLILGVINRKTDNNFQQFLISEDELEDDKEPYLQYAIRESTLYFLSDLVCEYFLKSEKDISSDKIKASHWYFSEYDLDATVRSMLSAIETIEKEFKELTDFDYNEFGNFLVNNLQMLYYDMGNRTQGEETFVVINTTGEPLSATENLKPIIIGNITDESSRKKASDEWEEREEWFWKNRKKEEATSDAGMNQFFVWYWQIRFLQERTWKNKKSYPLNPRELFVKKPKTDDENEENPEIDKWEESLKTETIHNYFNAFKKLVEISSEDRMAKVLKTIKNEDISTSWFRGADLHIVLPLIAYLNKFTKPQLFYEFVRRIRKNHFDEKRKRGNFVDWRHIIQIIEFSDIEEDVFLFKTKSNETIQFKNISNVELKEWYTKDEQSKNVLKQQYKLEIEHWEDHIDLMGDLTPLWEANESREYTYNNLKEVYDNFELLYNCYDEGKSEENPILSNYVRLYRALSEKERLTKPYNTSGMKGAWFSWIDSNDNGYFSYLKDEYFLSLFRTEKGLILSSVKSKIKGILPQEVTFLNDENFNAINHLKIWLLIKVLKAEKDQKLLAFYDGRGGITNGNGFASYDDSSKNKLNKELPFSIGNSICGYAVKKLSYLEYATNSWGDQSCFDTIIGNSITKDEFEKRETNPISEEKIAEIDEEIQSLLEGFYAN